LRHGARIPSETKLANPKRKLVSLRLIKQLLNQIAPDTSRAD
jgi:hypothetical protein